MVLSPGQRARRKAYEALKDEGTQVKLTIKVGDEIIEPPELAGVVSKISKDFWQNVSIKNEKTGAFHLKVGQDIQKGINDGVIRFIHAKDRKKEAGEK